MINLCNLRKVETNVLNDLLPMQVNIADASLPSFLAMLEYLYTDTLPDDITDDAVELMVLADRFGLPRLVAMCEQLIADSAGNCLGPLQLIQTTSDAINLLNIAKVCSTVYM